jgi:hypothetical protein
MKNVSHALVLISGVVVSVACLTIASAKLNASQVQANGGRNNECEDAQAKSVEQSQDAVTYATSNGNVVTGVCIKAGNDMFGDGHSESLPNGTYQDGCYTIGGVGTSLVTVKRLFEAETCKGISHIDVYFGPVPTNTPIPTVTPHPTDTLTPSPTPTSAPLSTPAPTNPPSDNKPPSTTCDATRPAAVALSIERLNAKKVRLTWTASPLANSYAIVYGTASNSYTYGVNSTGNSTSFDVGDLTPGQKYYFAVYAKNGCTMGEKSNEVSSSGTTSTAPVVYQEHGQVLGVSTELPSTGTADALNLIGVISGMCTMAYGYITRKTFMH